MKPEIAKDPKKLLKQLSAHNLVLAQTCQTLNRLYEERQALNRAFQAAQADHAEKTSPAHSHVKQVKTLLSEAKQLEAELTIMKLKTLQAKTQTQHCLAELENQRKIHHNALRDIQIESQKSLLLEILKSVDLFELSLNFKTKHPETQTFLDGMQMVYELFLKTLTRFAVQVLPLKVGDQYDYHRHEAIKAGYDPNFKDQTVLSVEQKGYLFNHQILRQAKVIINKYPSKVNQLPKQKEITKGDKKNE